MTYRKLRPGDPGHAMVAACHAQGKFVCDAVTHNSTKGCSNPLCFKFKKHHIHPVPKRRGRLQAPGTGPKTLKQVEQDGFRAASVGLLRANCPYRYPGLATVGAVRYFELYSHAWFAGYDRYEPSPPDDKETDRDAGLEGWGEDQNGALS